MRSLTSSLPSLPFLLLQSLGVIAPSSGTIGERQSWELGREASETHVEYGSIRPGSIIRSSQTQLWKGWEQWMELRVSVLNASQAHI